MEILSEDQHRALAFNAGGARPRGAELDRWLDEPDPSSSWSNASLAGAGLVATFRGSMSRYVVNIGWALDWGTGLELTKLGRALLRSAEQDADDRPDVLVLGKDDPLAYGQLISRLSDVRDGLLVDPYLDANELDLMTHSGIT